MKSKILPLFWLSLFSSFFTFTVWSKDESSLGLIESFSTLLDLEKNQNKKIRTTVSSNPKLFSEIKNFNHIQIEPWEWAGISLYTEKKYLEIAKKYPCAIYSLMDTKLLRSSYGKIFNIVAYADIPLTSQSQKNKREAFLISVEDYLATIYAKECQQNLTLKKDFSRINIINTLQKINFPEPKEEKDCQPILDKWMQDERLPYLCYFADLFSSSEYPTGPLSHLTQTPLKAEQEFEQRVDKAQELKKSISERNYFYIHNLCDHLLDANAFCGPYLNETYWTKVSQGVFPQEFSQALCSRRNNSNSLSNCLKNFKENPESCHALSFSHPAELLPHQNCENLSLSLKNSVIKKGIDDCPALIDNEALVNTARIYSFFKQPQKSADFPFSCAFNDSKIFSDLVEPESIRSAWDLKICFENKALRTQECHASLWGTNPESLLSEEKILEKIVSRMLGSSEPIKCEIVESSSFNPLLLEYRTGCFALYDKKNCTATFCPKKIINNQKEISGIKYQGNIHFDYLPTNLKTEQYSIQSLLHKKLLLKSKEITNFSELKFIFSGNKKTLVHGVGCAEDLLPFHFKRDALGGCKAMPFIISGIVEQGEKAQGIILHTSIESLAMPRIVHFQYLFSAVKNYQDIHPLTLWSLYALE